MRYLARHDRVTGTILDLAGASLAGFAIAHVVIAARHGFTGRTAVALAIVGALLALVILAAQGPWLELDGELLVQGPFGTRRRVPRAAIYFVGIEGDHLAICLYGGARLEVGHRLAYRDLQALRARLTTSRTASARGCPSATPDRGR